MKKQDTFYFDNFKACAEYSLKAARLLDEIMENYSRSTIKSYVDKMHEIEHSGDKKKHEMLEVLLKAFMTPIEWDDILLLSSCLDEVTDKIEDVALRMYCNDIEDIFEPAKKMVKVVIDSCEEMLKMMEEFKNFKKSKSLKEIIIKINTLEEDGDKLFIEGLRELHTKEKDPLKVIIWREILIYLEKCTDATEHVADICERVILTNT